MGDRSWVALDIMRLILFVVVEVRSEGFSLLLCFSVIALHTFSQVLAPRLLFPVSTPLPRARGRRCIYNHMSDSPECRSDRYTVIAVGEGGTEGAPVLALTPEAAEPEDPTNETRLDMADASSGVWAIKGVHFTQQCTKPWMCGQVAVSGECWRTGTWGTAWTFGAGVLVGELYRLSLFYAVVSQ